MGLEGRKPGLGWRPQGPGALIPQHCRSHQRLCCGNTASTQPSPRGQLSEARPARASAAGEQGPGRQG